MTDLAQDDSGSVAPGLGRLTQRTTPTTVAAVLRAAILDGKLKPGSQLRETHLASDLGVSRAPLREALGILADEGLVEKIPYRGAFVAEVSADAIAEIGLIGAARRMRFGRVDIGNADGDPVHMKCVAIDHAGLARAGLTQREQRG